MVKWVEIFSKKIDKFSVLISAFTTVLRLLGVNERRLEPRLSNGALSCKEGKSSVKLLILKIFTFFEESNLVDWHVEQKFQIEMSSDNTTADKNSYHLSLLSPFN